MSQKIPTSMRSDGQVVAKKGGLKEKVSKYWPLIAVGGAVGYGMYKEQKGADKVTPDAKAVIPKK